MNRQIRDDLTLAAYAVSLGYSIDFASAHFVAGIPQNGLRFSKGDVHVWETSRGWRMTKLVDGMFTMPQDSDFYKNLLSALEDGAEVKQ